MVSATINIHKAKNSQHLVKLYYKKDLCCNDKINFITEKQKIYHHFILPERDVIKTVLRDSTVSVK